MKTSTLLPTVTTLVLALAGAAVIVITDAEPALVQHLVPAQS